MTEILQQAVIGLSDGGIYACIALALVLVFRVSGTINFAQAEMAMISTFLAWTAINTFHWPYWIAFLFAVGASFVVGAGVQVLLIRTVGHDSHMRVLLLTIGLFYLCDGLAGEIWGYSTKSFASPVSNRSVDVLGVLFNQRQLLIIGVTLAIAGATSIFFRYSDFGVAIRAASLQPADSRLLGISVERVQAVGWGLAAAVGAVAGMLVAPTQFLQPTMMQPLLLFAFSAAILGGVDSMLGAVVGGLLLGLVLGFGTYLAPQLQTLNSVGALIIIVAILYVRPNGLFGRGLVDRV